MKLSSAMKAILVREQELKNEPPQDEKPKPKKSKSDKDEDEENEANTFFEFMYNTNMKP